MRVSQCRKGDKGTVHPTCQDLRSQLGRHPLHLVMPEGADVVQEPVTRLFPGQPQLLGVNDAICIKGFPHQPFGFLLVHKPDLRELLSVADSKVPIQKGHGPWKEAPCPETTSQLPPAPHLGAPRPHHGWMPAHTPPYPPLHLLALPRDALTVGCQALVLLSELLLLFGQFCSQVIEQAVEPGEGQQSWASPKRHLQVYPACMKALGLGAADLLVTTQCQGLTDPDAAGTGWPWPAYSKCPGDGPALG